MKSHFWITLPLVFLYDRRQLLPSPWCGLWVAAVTQTAERSLVSSLGRLCQERQKNILSLPLWANGSVQWMRKAWCMTISIRYCVVISLTGVSLLFESVNHTIISLTVWKKRPLGSLEWCHHECQPGGQKHQSAGDHCSYHRHSSLHLPHGPLHKLRSVSIVIISLNYCLTPTCAINWFL